MNGVHGKPSGPLKYYMALCKKMKIIQGPGTIKGNALSLPPMPATNIVGDLRIARIN